jgi:hypothetical protein
VPPDEVKTLLRAWDSESTANGLCSLLRRYGHDKAWRHTTVTRWVALARDCGRYPITLRDLLDVVAVSGCYHANVALDDTKRGRAWLRTVPELP